MLLPNFPMQNESRARMKPVAVHHSSPPGAGKAPGAPHTQQHSYGSLWPLGTDPCGPWAHGGVSQPWREGAQAMCLLPFPGSLTPAGLDPTSIAPQQHLRLGLQLQVVPFLQRGWQTDPGLLPTLQGPGTPQCPPCSPTTLLTLLSPASSPASIPLPHEVGIPLPGR